MEQAFDYVPASERQVRNLVGAAEENNFIGDYALTPTGRERLDDVTAGFAGHLMMHYKYTHGIDTSEAFASACTKLAMLPLFGDIDEEYIEDLTPSQLSGDHSEAAVIVEKMSDGPEFDADVTIPGSDTTHRCVVVDRYDDEPSDIDGTIVCEVHDEPDTWLAAETVIDTYIVPEKYVDV
jgi:hypothetical protein